MSTATSFLIILRSRKYWPRISLSMNGLKKADIQILTATAYNRSSVCLTQPMTLLILSRTYYIVMLIIQRGGEIQWAALSIEIQECKVFHPYNDSTRSLQYTVIMIIKHAQSYSMGSTV